MKFLTCSLNSCTTFCKGTEGRKAFFFPFANRQCRLKVINNLVGYMSQLILSSIVTFLSGLLASLLGLSISARPIHFGSRGLSDTSARCIDPEGLERLRTGTRKVTCTYCFFCVWSQAQSFQPITSKRQHSIFPQQYVYETEINMHY